VPRTDGWQRRWTLTPRREDVRYRRITAEFMDPSAAGSEEGGMKHPTSIRTLAGHAMPMLLAMLVSACANRDTATDAPPAASEAASPAPAASASLPAADAAWVRHKASGTRFRPPVGWIEHKDKDTRIYTPPDKGAVLAFEQFARGTDPGALILQVARKLKLENLDWKGGTREVKFGKDQIPGRTAEGDCTVGGEAAKYSYATLSTGSPMEVLIIYAVKKSAAGELGTHAKDSLRSIERE
jgi:hypothetical protein